MPNYLAPVLIYIASWLYTIAQYYHLHLTHWTFAKAMLIAMPLVVIEYCFSLNGNKLASQTMGPTQILLMTVGFYILNIMILNVFVFKHEINLIRDVSAVLLIVAAVAVSSNARL